MDQDGSVSNDGKEKPIQPARARTYLAGHSSTGLPGSLIQLIMIFVTNEKVNQINTVELVMGEGAGKLFRVHEI